MIGLLASVAIIVLQLAISHVFRVQAKAVLSGLLRDTALELIASAEMCSACFELIIVTDNYGWPAYAVLLFLMTIWWGHSWGEATACSYSTLEDYIQTDLSLTVMLAKILAQITGAIVSFRWVKQLWLLELTAEHVGRGVEECDADLKVPIMWGFLIEMVLTAACRIFSRTLSEFDVKYASSIDSFFATTMVILAFDHSGGYFNPVLATGLKWGCRGHTAAEHVAVYWAGSVIGALVALVTCRRCKPEQPIRALLAKYEAGAPVATEDKGEKED